MAKNNYEETVCFAVTCILQEAESIESLRYPADPYFCNSERDYGVVL